MGRPHPDQPRSGYREAVAPQSQVHGSKKDAQRYPTRPTITIQRTLTRTKGEWRLDEPETAESRRTVPLPEKVMTLLRAQHKGAGGSPPQKQAVVHDSWAPVRDAQRRADAVLADLAEAFSVNVEKLNERMFAFLDSAIIGVKGAVPGVALGVRARTDRNTEPR